MKFPRRYITSTYVPPGTWHTIVRLDERQFAATYKLTCVSCSLTLHKSAESSTLTISHFKEAPLPKNNALTKWGAS